MMLYHLLSFFLKLLSRIPFKAMYVLSDGLFYLLYYVVRYRRPLVRKNLTESFPEKSEKPITYNFFKNGIELSGGERQKVAIARLLYKNCDLYVLDEASSALDARSQNELCELIYNLPKDKTVVFISHRLTDMKLADKVIVLDDGSIIAEGTHTQLLDTCPKYKEMYDNIINTKFKNKQK